MTLENSNRSIENSMFLLLVLIQQHSKARVVEYTERKNKKMKGEPSNQKDNVKQ